MSVTMSLLCKDGEVPPPEVVVVSKRPFPGIPGYALLQVLFSGGALSAQSSTPAPSAVQLPAVRDQVPAPRGRTSRSTFQEPSACKAFTRFTADQVANLVSAFTVSQRPSGKEIAAIALANGLAVPQVRIWFQNRRAREKRKARGGMSRSLTPPVKGASTPAVPLKRTQVWTVSKVEAPVPERAPASDSLSVSPTPPTSRVPTSDSPAETKVIEDVSEALLMLGS
ncbi:hypothetical protein KIPB_007995 [Kipferlia bialata]|uniref:Homeobox domain-containing protein n=1 Tax=Kipferlia bialata TaxID=797122 RepID=A0A391P469_9EUKA|nr:hypothetical protein KIPB_007995 [Kipferlia bialata]|eukprot:g7995.t1